jgi:hypothetical protein
VSSANNVGSKERSGSVGDTSFAPATAISAL